MTPTWLRYALYLAAAYNLAWGSWVVLFPTHSFAWSGLEKPGVPLTYPQLWQCIGMIVGVYGVGYAVAGTDPARHWPVVLVGFLGKIFGPIGYAYGVMTGETPPGLIVTNFFNDIIWWVPFGLVLWHAWRTGGGKRHV
jgi:small multidrug resistance pump